MIAVKSKDEPPPPDRIPVVSAIGTPYEVGLAIGRHRQHRIAARVEAMRARRRSVGIDDATAYRSAQPYLALTEGLLPDLVVELAGIAAGAGVPFLELFRLNCPGTRLPAESPWQRQEREQTTRTGSEALPPAAGGGCTSMVSRGAGGVVLGHTEDFAPEWRDDLYVLRMQTGKTRLCALNYAQTLAGCAAAVNGAGLVQVIDSLHDRRHPLGISAHFLARGVLAHDDIAGAVDFLRRMLPRDGGFNHLLVQGKRIVNVEAGPAGFAVAEVTTDTYAHTNHYLNVLGKARPEPAANSVTRRSRALALLRPAMTDHDMYGALADRDGYPDSICRDRTIAAFIADTRQGAVRIAWGQPVPDGSTFHRYSVLEPEPGADPRR